MTITDYENNRTLHDVEIVLSRDETEELRAYLTRLLETPEIEKIYISEVKGFCLETELAVRLRQVQAA